MSLNDNMHWIVQNLIHVTPERFENVADMLDLIIDLEIIQS